MAAQSFPQPPFEPVTATIADIHGSLGHRQISVYKIATLYLSRILALNPTINAMISLNPNTFSDASMLDQQLSTTANVSALFEDRPLFGVPTILKDNFDCTPMNTTAGCLALNDSAPTTDAPTVAALKQAGALILGKSNLHELALEGLTVSSLGGQTQNPWDLTRTPGGSSGGSGAALAAGLAVLATGSDTVNSLRSPASANGLVSCRPTRGLISRSGIVPISSVQDVVGPIGKTVQDVAAMLNVMASIGRDSRDNATDLRLWDVDGIDYIPGCIIGSMDGFRLGLVTGFFNRTESSETSPVNDVVESLVRKIESSGATVVPVEDTTYNSSAILTNLDVQRYEYREQLTGYLERNETEGIHPKSMPELYAGHEYVVIPSQYEYVTNALKWSTGDPEYHERLRGISDLTARLGETFKNNNLDALIYPEQANLVVKVGSPSQKGRNGILGALTGSPVVTVPAGRSAPSKDAPRGVPIGIEILGRPWTESMLFHIASEIERLGPSNQHPILAEESVEIEEFVEVPDLVPNGVVPKEYPVGTLE